VRLPGPGDRAGDPETVEHARLAHDVEPAGVVRDAVHDRVVRRVDVRCGVAAGHASRQVEPLRRAVAAVLVAELDVRDRDRRGVVREPVVPDPAARVAVVRGSDRGRVRAALEPADVAGHGVGVEPRQRRRVARRVGAAAAAHSGRRDPVRRGARRGREQQQEEDEVPGRQRSRRARRTAGGRNARRRVRRPGGESRWRAKQRHFSSLGVGLPGRGGTRAQKAAGVSSPRAPEVIGHVAAACKHFEDDAGPGGRLPAPGMHGVPGRMHAGRPDRQFRPWMRTVRTSGLVDGVVCRAESHPRPRKAP